MRRLLVALTLVLAGAVATAPHSQAAGTTLVLDHVVVDNEDAHPVVGKWDPLTESSTTARYLDQEHGVRGDYEWTIPTTIPSDGAELTLQATATDTTGYRMYAYNSVARESDFGGAKDGSTMEITAVADKNAGKTTDTVTKTFAIVPATVAAGEKVYLTVHLGPEGPSISYVYKPADAADTKVKFSFHTTILPNGQKSKGAGDIDRIAVRGHGKGHILSSGGATNGKWSGSVAVVAKTSHGDDETGLVYAGGGEFGGTEHLIVRMNVRVRSSTLKGCRDGERGKLYVSQHTDGKSGAIGIEYCGRKLLWKRKLRKRFSVSVAKS